MLVERMGRGDVTAVLSLLEELDAHLGGAFVFERERVERQFARMDSRPDLYSLLVAREGDEVIGFMSMVNYESFYHKKGTSLVNELVVSKSARGQGVGSALLARAMVDARAAGYDEIEVGVSKDNAGAIRFYKEAGLDEEYLLLGKEFA